MLRRSGHLRATYYQPGHKATLPSSPDVPLFTVQTEELQMTDLQIPVTTVIHLISCINDAFSSLLPDDLQSVTARTTRVACTASVIGNKCLST